MIEEKIMKTILSVITGLPGNFRSDDGLHSLTSIIAEKKGFFSRRTLTFTARFRVNEETQEVIYNETLVEKKSGLGAGNGEGIFGFGFRKWKITAGPSGLDGVLEERSEMLDRKYGFTFRFQQIRDAVRKLVEDEGYSFKHQVWGKL
ncbi:ribonucleoside-triphosphate reductase [Aminivibrio sp.]|uniref:ribonucleoside-triphosphate reductase n=1 Tax=Aminivibrio sp. TaxID=1872489 RepID=UPI001A3F0C62|nr:ribonucleoside-triphosphate reductase [Aminivibrio sp.]MBL3539783.1 ribonucleoside-triphosphate reductase [Aminivibrio sp.]